MIRLFLIGLFLISTCKALTAAQVDISFYNGRSYTVDCIEYDNTTTVKPKFKRLKAVLLAVFLGHFGVHRIYLGTSPNVPVVYSLTLGGGLGLLPLLDIAAILSTRDLEKFSNNKKVFMWSGEKKN